MKKEELEKAKKAIRQGKIVVYPTETAYAIGVDATNKEAIEKVYNAKKRPKTKGLTTIVPDKKTAINHGDISKKEEKIIDKLMPGPITLVTEKKETLPDNLNEKFVFRISSHETSRELASETPITATSANISGQETSYRVDDIDQSILNKAEVIINTGPLEQKPTSTITELNTDITVHREGPVSKEEIINAIK